MEMPNCASYVLHTHDVIDSVTRSKNKSNLKIAMAWSVYVIQRRNKYGLNLWPRAIFLIHSSFGFGFSLKDSRRSIIETVFGNYPNPFFAHASILLQI